MTTRTRLCWLIVLFLGQILYIPINRFAKGGVELNISLDSHIPLLPIWVVPYLLSLAWWTSCYIWAALEMSPDLYRALVVSTLFTMLTAYAFYLLYPTYVIRPLVEARGWEYDLLRELYANDRAYNAFPSGHAYTSLLILFYWWTWKPHLRWLWLAIVLVILLSTLFTRQHYLIDLLGGLLWAVMGLFFGYWWNLKSLVVSSI